MSLLNVSNLSVEYQPENRSLLAVDGLGFSLDRGESLGIVGESGCGKTTAMLAVMRLLPEVGKVTSGKVMLEGVDLLQLDPDEIREIRWKRISMVFQSAMNALNPTRTIESQIVEVLQIHKTPGSQNRKKEVAKLLDLVGISANRAKQYPHQFSGGMRQRAMIAMALACNPDILIADEPTTALDVMIQAQILKLLGDLQRELHLSTILVTHDLGSVSEICGSVLVMYGGWLVEYGAANAIFNSPRHPYTQKLLQAFPDINRPKDKLTAIPGYPPPLDNLPSGCRFHPRCHRAAERCKKEIPPEYEIHPGHLVKCFFPGNDERQEGFI